MEKKGKGNYEAFALFSVFLTISIVFYVTLGVVKSSETGLSPETGNSVFDNETPRDFSFGFLEVFISLIFAGFATWFLLWIKGMSKSNPYLGSILGFVGLGVMLYAFSLRYRGPYSAGFMLFTSLIVMGYIGRNFFKFKNKEKVKEEFDVE